MTIKRADGGITPLPVGPSLTAGPATLDHTFSAVIQSSKPGSNVVMMPDIGNRIMATQRKADGGTVTQPGSFAGGGLPTAPWFIRRSAQQMGHIGAINSPVAGRTDHIPLNVASGSYVVPADIVSGMGQGNSAAGHSVLGRMFKAGPYGGAASPNLPKPSLPKPGKSMMSMPKPPNLLAAGGPPTPQPGALVPIMAAGGEHVLGPDQVMTVGGGDLKKGHEILDHFVKIMREKHVKTLKKLPGPAKR